MLQGKKIVKKYELCGNISVCMKDIGLAIWV